MIKLVELKLNPSPKVNIKEHAFGTMMHFEFENTPQSTNFKAGDRHEGKLIVKILGGHYENGKGYIELELED